MTLTTERLKQLADPNMICKCSWDEYKSMAAELLANREAQPVGYIDPDSLKEYRGQRAGGTWSAVQRTTSGLNMTTPIYTAPPAPANARPVAWEMRYWNSGHNMWHDWERITAEQHAEMSVLHAADNDYEFRVLYDAPPTPQLTNVSDWGINMQTGTPILVYKNCSVIESEQAHYVLSLINSAATLAPAAVKLPTEFYSDEGIVVRLEEVMAALAVVGVQCERKANAKTRCEFPSSEVPEEMNGGIAMSKYKVKKSNYSQWVKGWNACRAAMLAQPVSSGYKLVPVEPTDEQLRLMLAVQWPALYREHLRHPLNGPKSREENERQIAIVKRQYAAMLAAAPEGGN
ncbi:hypothetical protein ABI244_05415 [Serratia ureilytica]|uniref:hypothetical protein n=1 Tax=Serratia ureilytica TaxID=300181 RepID=UPI00326582F5